MKKGIAMKSIIMIAIAFVTLMVGCKKPVEQSTVSIDDFKEKATIIGHLTYDEGQVLEGTSYTTSVKPAANVKVTAVIASSEFSMTGSNKGNLTYTTTTDEEGNYEIVVPVTNSGVNVRVKITNFTGQYKRIVDVKDGQAVYEYEDVVYKLDDMEFFLEPDDVEVADGLFEYVEREEEFETATIVGMLMYDEGQGFDGTNYTRLIKPAANVSVTASIAKAEFPETAGEEGYLTFTTRTSSEGAYEIEVPVTSAGVNVKVEVVSFIGQYHQIIDVEDGEPVYEDMDVIYSLEDKEFRLEPNDIKVLDGEFTYEARETMEEYYNSEYRVVVGQAHYEKDNDTTVKKKYKEAANVDVVIKVTYKGETFTYVSSTDNEGVATFNLPTDSKTWEPEIEVEAKQYTTDNFRYYKVVEESGKKKVEDHRLSGYFKQESGFKNYPEFTDVEGMPVPECRVKMNFNVFDGEDDHGHKYEDWDGVSFTKE